MTKYFYSETTLCISITNCGQVRIQIIRQGRRFLFLPRSSCIEKDAATMDWTRWLNLEPVMANTSPSYDAPKYRFSWNFKKIIYASSYEGEEIGRAHV